MSEQKSSETNGTATTTTEVGFEDHSSFTAAYEKRLAEIHAIDDDALAALNVDVHSAVATVLGVLPEIAPHREAMSTLPGLDQGKVGGLEEYAQAAAEAHSRWVTAMRPPEDIVALNDEAMAMRETFRSDATALAKRGLIAREQVAAFKGLVGYKNVAFDLIDWANLMRDSWSNIQGKTALTAGEVQQAKELGERLVRAAGVRDQAPMFQAEAARVRQQAMTLLLGAYDETRRAITYLRWHQDDVESIAPSLYAGKTRAVTDAPAPNPPEPPPNPPAPPAPPAPVVNASAPAAHAAGTSATTGLAAVAAGLPGAPPFAGA